MRKRFFHCRLCSCSPEKGVIYLDARMLQDIVNRGIHSIRCASTCAHKAHRGLYLGKLCAEAHHPWWALKIWKFTLDQIHAKDWDDWLYVTFNPEYVRLQDVISDGICEIIGRHIDDLERQCGLSDAHGRDSWEYLAGDGWYDYFRSEKYHYGIDWEEWRDEIMSWRSELLANQQAARIFREGQGNLPPSSQNFFDYWTDCDSDAEDLNFKIDDWDDS